MNFHDIDNTEEAWGDALGQLLARASAALEHGPREQAAVIDDLTRFIAMSPVAFGALDAIAKRAADDLINRRIHESLARIAERTEELRRHLALLGHEVAAP